jgi:hypothetical protein
MRLRPKTIMSQAQLDAQLDRVHVIPIEISLEGPLPQTAVYAPVRGIAQTGLQITTRELLHAIGSKTAALPANAQDDCLRASLLYTYVLALDQPELCLKTGIESDLKTPRSQELGIGMLCLLANKCLGIPWDQLGALPGPGLRFDYRGRANGVDGIFESKGTSHRGKQAGQIAHGLDKKEAHHARGDHFDIELICSTFVGVQGEPPRIILADPDFDEMSEIYGRTDDRFFRLRHYARILQFVGLPQSALRLNRFALHYLRGNLDLRQTILDEKALDGFLEVVSFGVDRYFGRWFDQVLPPGSRRYSQSQYGQAVIAEFAQGKKNRVFQGVHEDVYQAGLEAQPFAHELFTTGQLRAARRRLQRGASVFEDGTIQIFERLNG